MTRSFTDEPVPTPVVDQLLEEARRAPSAGNTLSTSTKICEVSTLPSTGFPVADGSR